MTIEQLLELAADWDLSYEVNNLQEDLLNFVEEVLCGDLDHFKIVDTAKNHGFNPYKNDDIIYFAKDLLSRYMDVFDVETNTTLH